MWWWWSAALALGACPDDGVSRAELREALNSINQALVEARFNDFDPGYERVQEHFKCLRDPLTPVEAGALHRLNAIQAFLQSDEPVTREAFLAARLVEPDFVLPLDPWVAGHPLRVVFEDAARAPEPPWVELPSLANVTYTVDGNVRTARREGLPAVVQILWAEDDVENHYVGSSDPFPVVVVSEDTSPPVQLSRKTVAFGVGGAGVLAAGAGGALYARSWSLARERYVGKTADAQQQIWEDEVRPLYVVGIALMAGGGLALAGSTTLLVMPTAGGGQAWVTARW